MRFFMEMNSLKIPKNKLILDVSLSCKMSGLFINFILALPSLANLLLLHASSVIFPVDARRRIDIETTWRVYWVMV